MGKAVLVGVAAAASVGTARRLLRRGIVWGSTQEERTAALPGDAYMAGGPQARAMMTRCASLPGPSQ